MESKLGSQPSREEIKNYNAKIGTAFQNHLFLTQEIAAEWSFLCR